MKIKYRIPSKGPFGFVEIEIEKAPDLEKFVDGAVEELERLMALQKGGEGLPDKDFKAALDEYLSTGTLRGGTELYAQMNPEQQKILQTVKLSLKRIKAKGEPEVDADN